MMNGATGPKSRVIIITPQIVPAAGTTASIISVVTSITGVTDETTSTEGIVTRSAPYEPLSEPPPKPPPRPPLPEPELPPPKKLRKKSMKLLIPPERVL